MSAGIFGGRTVWLWVAACLVVAGALALVSNPAGSQDVSRDEAQAETRAEAAPQDGGQYERLLKMALGGCFKPPADVSDEAAVTIGFELDGQGRLSGMPALEGKGEVTADVRRLFLTGALALDRCAPYPPEGAGARFEVVFASDEVRALRRLAAPEEASSEQRAAAAVLLPSSGESEEALGLTRAKRREIQRRLQVLEYEPGGVDGVFGQKTRDAISAWQGERGFPVSGYLSVVQLLALNAQSQQAYAEFLESQPQEPERKRRVRICRPVGLLGLQKCHYEYR